MNQKLKRYRNYSALLALLAAIVGAPRAHSQTANSPATSNEKITSLEKFTISEVPVDEQVLPTVRPISSIFGDDRSIIDTPRSVSSVNEAWMKDRQVKNAMDLGQFAPGVYSAAQYGIPAVPFIRGDLSQIYMNGQMSLFSRNSTPPSFNGVAALDIVKGPGSAVYGPQGEGAGGYVNFVTKEPYFDRMHLDVDLSLQGWTSGRNYFNPEASIDFGGPLTDKLAYRVSYLSRYGKGYYINYHDETQDVFAALTYRASSTLKLDWWAQMYSDRTNENTGANRVTQDFIWNGTYVGGPASPAVTGPTAFFGFDIYAAPNPPAGSFATIPDGGYSVINPATAYRVKLPAYDSLIGPADTARSKTFHTQLRTTLSMGPDTSVQNLTYFANGDSKKYETYGYDEFVPKQQSFQDRLEYHTKYTDEKIENSVIMGLDFRYSALVAYQDFATEPFTYYDLYQSLSKVFYPGYYLEGKSWGGGLQVPGADGYSAYSGTSGNQYSHIYDTAAFFQDDMKFNKQWSLIAGYRIDRVKADTANPSFVQTGYYNSFFEYVPLASPIYIPKGGSSPYYTGFNVTDSKWDQSYFGSLSFKPTETMSFYLTYSHVNAILGSANFGGVNVSPGGSAITKLDNAITTTSTLYEGGYKQSFLHNTLYVGAAVFQQLKYGTEITGATFPIKDNGIELDAVYQPNTKLTLNANFTYQNATAFGSSFYQQTGNYLDMYATTFAVDGKFGTGLGGPNFTSYHPPGGRVRAPGIPQVQANFFVDYKITKSLGFGIGPQFIGRQYANSQSTLHIPGEYQLDGYVYFRMKHWDARVNVRNITNNRVLDPIDVSFAGNDTIYVRPPISASLDLGYHF